MTAYGQVCLAQLRIRGAIPRGRCACADHRSAAKEGNTRAAVPALDVYTALAGVASRIRSP
jgi:hypothetical protein